VAQVGSPPHRLQSISLGQLVGYRYLIYALIPIIEREASIIDPTILISIKVLRAEKGSDLIEGFPINQQRTYHRLFGVYIVRGQPVRPSQHYWAVSSSTTILIFGLTPPDNLMVTS
jgi:hypothetical protein